MTTADHYRRQAAEMLRRSIAATTAHERLSHLDLAQSWEAVARQSDAFAQAVFDAAVDPSVIVDFVPIGLAQADKAQESS